MTLSDLSCDFVSELADGLPNVDVRVRDSAGTVYQSVREASRILGVSQRQIDDVLAGRRQSAGGLTFRFA